MLIVMPYNLIEALLRFPNPSTTRPNGGAGNTVLH